MLTEAARRKAEEREAHILGDGPRLQPLELNELSSDLLAILAQMESVNSVLNSNAEVRLRLHTGNLGLKAR